MVEGNTSSPSRESSAFPSGTEFIFNTDTRISASCKTNTGDDTANVWLEVQKI